MAQGFSLAQSKTYWVEEMTVQRFWLLHTSMVRFPENTIGANAYIQEIFENGFLPPSSRLAFAHMEVQSHPTEETTEAELTYLYNLKPGRSISTFGIM